MSTNSQRLFEAIEDFADAITEYNKPNIQPLNINYMLDGVQNKLKKLPNLYVKC